MTRATGTFEVEMKPEPPFDAAKGATLARITLDKRFSGDLDGTSKVTMLGATTDVKGSAGYVALERVAATLGGRRGTFVLQHSGIMSARGTGSLTVVVVPDSATDDLAGLSGSMSIEIVEGQHRYAFEYEIG